MHAHRSDWPDHIAAPGSPAFDDQRRLLLELVVDPPSHGEPVAELARRLGRPRTAIRTAARALDRAGLLHRERGTLRASPSALAFEALWPAAL